MNSIYICHKCNTRHQSELSRKDCDCQLIKGIDSGADCKEDRDIAWKLLHKNGFVDGEMNSFCLNKQFTQIVDSYIRQDYSPCESLALSIVSFAPTVSKNEKATLCTLISNICEQDNPSFHKAIQEQLDRETKLIPQEFIDKLMADPSIPSSMRESLKMCREEDENA